MEAVITADKGQVNSTYTANAAKTKVAFAGMRTAFVGAAQRLSLNDERDVAALVDEIREEMWLSRYADND